MKLAFNRLCFDSALANSFYHIQTLRVRIRLLEVRRLSNPVWVQKILNYVVKRQNEDGGYTFCQGTESNAQDTYYGLSIQSLLNASFPAVEKTALFLNALDLDNLYSKYYVTKALMLCGTKPKEVSTKNIVSILNSKKDLSDINVFAEVSSEFLTTFMALELAELLRIDFNRNEVAKWLLQFKNDDGGFGTKKHSNINSTYCAVASLRLLKWNIKDLNDAVIFARKCEKPYGGFTVIPMGVAPYMEHTYYGVMTLELLGETCRYPSQIIAFLLNCQNKNGGFARSDLGISTFENTFQAVSIMKALEK